jgi:Transglutaminase-like superfamily
VWAVRRLSPEIYGEERGCLRRSLVLGFLLREHAPLLRIGVQRDSDQNLRAHAWIDVGGLAVDAGSDFVSLNG